MSNKIQTIIETVAGAKPANNSIVKGQLYTNVPDLRLGVGRETTPGDTTADSLIPVTFHSATADYSIGDVVVYNAELYRCTTAHTAHAFTGSEWTGISGYDAGKWTDITGGITHTGGTVNSPNLFKSGTGFEVEDIAAGTWGLSISSTLGVATSGIRSNNGDMDLQLGNVFGSTTIKIGSNSDSYFMGGDVGINNSSPDYPLDVGGTIRSSVMYVEGSAGGNMLYLKDTGGAGSAANPFIAFYDSAHSRQGYMGAASTSDSDLHIKAEQGRLRLISSNVCAAYSASTDTFNVGSIAGSYTINASAPLFGGQVVKSQFYKLNTVDGPGSFMMIRGSNGGAATGLRQVGLILKGDSEASTGASSKMGAIYIESELTYGNSPYLCLATANVERVRILSNGDVGIGVTPTEQLHVAGNIKLTGTVIGPDTGWTTATGYRYRQLADGTVAVELTANLSASGTLAAIPTAYRPQYNMIFVVPGTSVGTIVQCRMTTGGVITNLDGVSSISSESSFMYIPTGV